MQQYRETDYRTINYEIAKLDRQIIFNLAQRFQYMELARSIKDENNLSESVDNFRLMLEQRKNWAISAGFNQDFIHKMSQYLIDYYLTEEI